MASDCFVALLLFIYFIFMVNIALFNVTNMCKCTAILCKTKTCPDILNVYVPIRKYDYYQLSCHIFT